MRLKKRIQYKAEAKWDKKTGGEVAVNGFNVNFDSPSEYGGYERHPCPDQLFLSSITGCLMNTFLYYKNHLGVKTEDLKIAAQAEIKLVNPHGYRIEQIYIHIEVWSSEEEAELNHTCAYRARDYCHLTKSIESAIPIKILITVHRD
jgi:organic hydroperoxide reductase OsmC/OhrA